ncbi:diguanylate cyclase domain-containing protein, partial [Bacillus altitudinis]|uniref:diguanylate cyclase domain-containing protein n=1 Tax=Bacillus altitudinis TaxID=293387 RepID=UPI001F169198
MKGGGKRVRKCLRDNGFIGRIGGDEFLMMFGEVEDGRDKIEEVWKKMIGEFEGGFLIEKDEVIRWISIG